MFKQRKKYKKLMRFKRITKQKTYYNMQCNFMPKYGMGNGKNEKLD